MGKKKTPEEADDRPVDLRGRSLAVERLLVGGRELRPVSETKARQVARQVLDDALPGLEERAGAAAADVEERLRADLEALRTAASTDLRAAGEAAAGQEARVWARLEDLGAAEAQLARTDDRLAAHEERLGAAADALGDLDERVDGLDTELAATRAAVDAGAAASQAGLAGLREQLRDVAVAVDDSAEAGRALHDAQAAVTDAALAEVGERLDGIEGWAGRAEGRLATLEDVSGSLEASIGAHATALGLRVDDSAERLAAELAEHARAVRGQFVEAEDAMSGLRRVVAAQEPTLHLLRQDVVDLQVAASTFAMYASYRPTADNGVKLGPGAAAVLGWDRPVLRHDSVTVSRGAIRVAKAGHYRIDVGVTLLAADNETIGSLSVCLDDAVVETLPLHHLRPNPHRVYLCALVHATPESVLTVRLANELDAGADARRAIHFMSQPELGLLQVQSVRLDRG